MHLHEQLLHNGIIQSNICHLLYILNWASGCVAMSVLMVGSVGVNVRSEDFFFRSLLPTISTLGFVVVGTRDVYLVLLSKVEFERRSSSVSHYSFFTNFDLSTRFRFKENLISMASTTRVFVVIVWFPTDNPNLLTSKNLPPTWPINFKISHVYASCIPVH